MRLVCAPLDFDFDEAGPADLQVVLYGHADQEDRGEVGANILEVHHRRLFLDMPARGARLDVTVEARNISQIDATTKAAASSGGQSASFLLPFNSVGYEAQNGNERHLTTWAWPQADAAGATSAA